MRRMLFMPALVLPLPLGACANEDYGGRAGYGRPGFSDRDRDHLDGLYFGYRRDARQRRQIGKKDRIYCDRDGHCYCQCRDGSRGAIVGALAGGLLSHIMVPGDTRTLGTILGVGGSLAGSDQSTESSL